VCIFYVKRSYRITNRQRSKSQFIIEYVEGMINFIWWLMDAVGRSVFTIPNRKTAGSTIRPSPRHIKKVLQKPFWVSKRR
jgi:hypothetical protein